MTPAAKLAAEALRKALERADIEGTSEARSCLADAATAHAPTILAALSAESTVPEDRISNRERAKEIVQAAIEADGEDPGPLIDLITEELDRRSLSPHATGEWRPIEEAPKDGRWIIAICHDRETVKRVSWGRDQTGALYWCSGTNSYGDGLFAGWIPAPPSPKDAGQ